MDGDAPCPPFLGCHLAEAVATDETLVVQVVVRPVVVATGADVEGRLESCRSQRLAEGWAGEVGGDGLGFDGKNLLSQ